MFWTTTGPFLFKRAMKKYDRVFLHDMFNIMSLVVIIFLDMRYLYHATIWDHLGTSDLGKDHVGFASILLFTFFIYVVIDTLWIAVIPNCVLSSPMALIIHHFFTFLFLLLPYYIVQFHWHGAVSMFVEINVFFLVSRRQFLPTTAIYKCLDFLFLLTWFFFRLVLFPVLLVFYSYEYRRYSMELGGQWFNIVLLAPVLQVRHPHFHQYHQDSYYHLHYFHFIIIIIIITIIFIIIIITIIFIVIVIDLNRRVNV